MTNPSDIIEKAKKASLGPWSDVAVLPSGLVVIQSDMDKEPWVCEAQSDNAQFIASLSPDIIIPLMERLIELEKEVARLQEYEWMYKDLCQ